MFCKYCGQNIPDIAEFCPECGKKLKHKENEELERRQALSTPLALMFFMLCWNTLRAWGNMLLFDNQLSLAALLSTVMLAAALVLFAILAGRDMIHMEDYRFTDLLVLCCVWMVVPALLGRWAAYVSANVISQYGKAAFWAWSVWENNMIPVIQVPVFWLMLGVILLGLTRRGGWQLTRKHSLIVTAVLFGCSVFGFLFAPVIAMSAYVPEEIIAMAVQMTRLWALLCWLWPLVILKGFHALGEGRVGIGGTIAAFLGMQLGEALLLLVFVVMFGMGLSGAALAKGLAPLFGLFILKIGSPMHKETRV